MEEAALSGELANGDDVKQGEEPKARISSATPEGLKAFARARAYQRELFQEACNRNVSRANTRESPPRTSDGHRLLYHIGSTLPAAISTAPGSSDLFRGQW